MRVVNWQETLEAVFHEARGKRFRWGSHDCCQFAARCVAAITGDDARDLFPRYHSRAEAEQVIADCGDLLRLIMKALGDNKPVSMASDGDIVLIDMGRGLQPGVCRGLNSFAPGRHGLVHRPTLNAVAAWTV